MKDKPTEIRALAGARALPPLLLVLYHYHEGHGYQHFRLFDVFVAKGYLWVEFFFALSGFVLIHTYLGQAAAFRKGPAYFEFLKVRLARLYPLHIATLLVMVVMMVGLRALAARGGYLSIYDAPGYHPFADGPSFVANIFLVQAWHLFPHLSWNGVSWFVSVLFFLMLIFPLFLSLAERGIVAALALILFGFAALFGLISNSGHGLDITFDFGVIRGLADFSIGVGLAVLYRACCTIGAQNWSESNVSMIQLVVLGVFLAAIYGTGWSHTVRDYWVLPPMMALILALSFDRGIVARFFQLGILRKLGEWSFAIYLGQTALLQFLRFAEQRLYPQANAAGGTFLHILEPTILVLAAVPWGWLLFQSVEKPANAWLRHRILASSPRQTAPS